MWGLVVLAAMMALVWTGGYHRLERIQLVVVFTMLACVSVSLALLRPRVMELWLGLWGLADLRYPDWIAQYDEFARRPLWVELVTYVGVIGGSGYDYLAYVSFLREKGWGAVRGPVVDGDELQAIAAQPDHPNRRWILAPLCDSVISFVIVLLFSAIFLTCGAEVLRPAHQLPAGTDLLTLQAEFVSRGLPGFRPIYFAGALLAMLGTLYGTIEVAPTIAYEALNAFGYAVGDERRLHRWVTGWVGLGGGLVLLGSLLLFLNSGLSQPPSLISILTPANLFTGVLACGMIALTALWMDRRWLPAHLRPMWILSAINSVGGVFFLGLGLKAYWDHGGVAAWGILAATFASGWFVAMLMRWGVERVTPPEL